VGIGPIYTTHHLLVRTSQYILKLNIKNKRYSLGRICKIWFTEGQLRLISITAARSVAWWEI